MIKQYMAMKAVVEHRGKVLILRESADHKSNTHPGEWGVPGGRLKPGEDPSTALRREVREESGLEVEIGKPLTVDQWQPVILGEPSQVVAVFLQCTTATDTVTVSHEHDASAWVAKNELDQYPMMAEDRRAIETLFASQTPT